MKLEVGRGRGPFCLHPFPPPISFPNLYSVSFFTPLPFLFFLSTSLCFLSSLIFLFYFFSCLLFVFFFFLAHLLHSSSFPPSPLFIIHIFLFFSPALILLCSYILFPGHLFFPFYSLSSSSSPLFTLPCSCLLFLPTFPVSLFSSFFFPFNLLIFHLFPSLLSSSHFYSFLSSFSSFLPLLIFVFFSCSSFFHSFLSSSFALTVSSPIFFFLFYSSPSHFLHFLAYLFLAFSYTPPCHIFLSPVIFLFFPPYFCYLFFSCSGLAFLSFFRIL